MLSTDVEAVVAIETLVEPVEPWTRGIFDDCLRVHYPCWVIEINGQIVGFLVILLAVEECHILNIAIAPAFQRQGLAKQFLAFLFEVLPDEVSTLLLEVRVSNTPALELYKHYGFEEIGIRRGYYSAADGKREDARVMRKRF